jgi:hypothetical protein
VQDDRTLTPKRATRVLCGTFMTISARLLIDAIVEATRK